MRPLPACLVVIMTLAACADPYPLAPDLAAEGKDAPYPALVPVERIAARVPATATATVTEATTEAIASRTDRLRARADRLRGPVIDAETGERMRRGVDG